MEFLFKLEQSGCTNEMIVRWDSAAQTIILCDKYPLLSLRAVL